ncbi:MAG: hypothetical protein OEW12_06900, partial [Deltaproteobacteria bacterium]|nr:hypothetical protein [Deltaproteobacteria bacterium]
LRADGMTFTPPASWLPLDWLVSDMLVPPGKTLGLLRSWLGQRLTARFVVNIKLPQHHPYTALKPIEDFVGQLPGCRFTLRQLYHDRREVTLMGRLGGNLGKGGSPVAHNKPNLRPNPPKRPFPQPGKKSIRP